jgi:hypothetical protein
MRAEAVPGPSAAVTLVGVVGVAAYIGALTWAINEGDSDLWGALVLFPVLVAISVPLLRRVARAEGDPRMLRLILLALVVKLSGAFVRYYLTIDLYGGLADAASYANHGARLAESYRQGIFSGLEVGRSIPGTGFVRVLTGLVFTVTGPTRLGGFLIFSWFAFWGLYFFYRAFRIAAPEADYRRYALFVFFLPSLVFWPSSIGKEAWMVLTLGLSAYGAARVLSSRPGGYVVLGLGLVGAGLVRPHMSALVCAGVVIAYALRRRPQTQPALGSLGRVVGLVILLGVTSVVVTQVEDFFGTEEEGIRAAEEVFDSTEDQTSQGGSEFEARRVRSPADLPMATLGVLFRPLPFDAHNAQALLASIESTLLLMLFVFWWRRMVRIPKEMFRNPYVLFALVFTAGFVVAFSTFSNFGLLARQRVQVLPLLLAAVMAVKASDVPRRHSVRNYEVVRHPS